MYGDISRASDTIVCRAECRLKGIVMQLDAETG